MRERVSTDKRDRLLDDAIQAGKFRESRRAHYAAMYDRDPAGTTAAIKAMAGIGRPLGGSGPAAGSGEYDDSRLSPTERERVRVARSGEAPAPSSAEYEDTRMSRAERERIRTARSGAAPAAPARRRLRGPVGEVGRGDGDMAAAGTMPMPSATADDGGYERSFLRSDERARIDSIKNGSYQHDRVHVERQA